MPITQDQSPPSLKNKLNQSLIKSVQYDTEKIKKEISDMRKDIDKLDEKISFIYTYIVNKKEREDARWFY